MKIRIILAAALVGILGCNRDTRKSAASQPPAQAASANPRKHLADSFAKLWGLIQKEKGSYKPVEDWTRALADAKSPEAIAGRRYHQALQVLLPPDNHESADSFYRYATHRDAVIDEILLKNQPEFAKRWTSGEFTKVLEAYHFGTLGGHSPFNERMLYPQEDASTPATAMSEEQATQACVDFIMMLSREVLEPGEQIVRLHEQIDKLGGPLMLVELPAVYSLSFDQWFAGQGPANLDMPGDLKNLLAQYHPEIADPVMELITARMIHGTVANSQRRVKSDLGAIAKAEHDYVDRIIDENDGYWTADVSGLYRARLNDQPIALLRPETARLDVHPANLPNEAPLPAPPATKPDDELPKYAIAVVPVTDPSHFAFCAYPFGYGRVGRQTYLLTDANKLWVKDTDGKAVDRLPDNPEADGWTVVETGDDRELAKTIPSQGPLAQLKDPDATVRTAALKRIAGIEAENVAYLDLPCGPSPAALRAIANALDDDNHFVRGQAIEIAQHIGKPILADAEPVVLKCLRSDPAAPVNEELGNKRLDAVNLAVALELESDQIKACYKRLARSNDANLAQAAASALGIPVPNTPHFQGYWVANEDESDGADEVPDGRAAGAADIRLSKQIFDETAIKSVGRGQGLQGPLINITMTAQGGKQLEAETTGHIGRQLAIVVDGKVCAVMTIQAVLDDSAAVITGLEEDEVQRIIKAFEDIQKLNEESEK